ncbi:MAG: DUF4124 domain-containing protein [Gammaproteobacteria bacterium]|nr:DUF4124 domain-containing protein [Gammaproteobacteria bacterium]
MQGSLIRRGGALLATIALACSVAVAGDIYRWTDANGVVHFGERPPATGGDRVELRNPTGQGVGTDAAAAERRQRQQRMLDAYSHERDRKRRQQAEAEVAEARNQRQCDRLQRHWRSLSWGGPVYYGEQDGGRRYLSESERTEEKRAVRKTYEANCRGSID